MTRPYEGKPMVRSALAAWALVITGACTIFAIAALLQ